MRNLMFKRIILGTASLEKDKLGQHKWHSLVNNVTEDIYTVLGLKT